MSCHVMSCHVMSCHVMSCHVMSCHVMSCHVMSRLIMSYYMSLDFSDQLSIKSGWEARGSQLYLPRLSATVCCQAVGKM
jgi:hypothetical protein